MVHGRSYNLEWWESLTEKEILSKDFEEVKEQAMWYLGEDHFWRREQQQKREYVRTGQERTKN